MTISTAADYAAYQREIVEGSPEAVRRGVNNLVDRTVEECQGTAPVLTGRYRDGIHGTEATTDGDTITAAVEFDAPYSRAVQARNPHAQPALERMDELGAELIEQELEALSRRIG